VSRRAVVTLAVVVMVAGVALLFVQGARAWGFTVDRLRRAEEIMARESSLYRQLANQDGVIESQRRIYIERFRKLEAQLQQRDEHVAVLRERLATMQGQQGNDIETRVIARQVHGRSSSPFTGGQER
jgi:uncharacterized protein HemX